MSLRAFLSGSRKRPLPASAASGSKKRKTTASSTAARTTPWPADTALRQTKPGSGGGRRGDEKSASGRNSDDDPDGIDLFSDFDDDDDRYPLQDTGLVTMLADDLSLRDVVQALRYARGDMFDALPQQLEQQQRQQQHQQQEQQEQEQTAAGGRGGLFVGNSTRVAELLQMRRRMPPLATTAHVAALLPNATATERETAALVRAGVLRRVVQPQWRRGVGARGGGGGSGGKGGGGGSGGEKQYDNDARLRRALALGTESLGEVLIETAALQQLVQDSSGLDDATKQAFLAWLARGAAREDDDNDNDNDNDGKETEDARGARFTINGQPAPQLTGRRHMVDALVRAGFLVGHGSAAGAGVHVLAGQRGSGMRATAPGDVFARPEDRTSMLSLETVARAASGSYEAVGGVGAVYAAGGGGGGGGASGSRHRERGSVPAEDLLLAIPGHGLFVKLVSGALAHLVGLLAHTPFRETLESTLRERWNAGGGGGGEGGGLGSGSAGSRPRRSRISHPGWLRRVPASRTRKWKDFYGLRFEWVLAEALGAGLVELFDTGSVGRGVRLLS